MSYIITITDSGISFSNNKPIIFNYGPVYRSSTFYRSFDFIYKIHVMRYFSNFYETFPGVIRSKNKTFGTGVIKQNISFLICFITCVIGNYRGFINDNRRYVKRKKIICRACNWCNSLGYVFNKIFQIVPSLYRKLRNCMSSQEPKLAMSNFMFNGSLQSSNWICISPFPKGDDIWKREMSTMLLIYQINRTLRKISDGQEFAIPNPFKRSSN